MWLTCSGNRGEQGFLTAGLGAVQSHFILQGFRSGLRGSWPQIQHFRRQRQGEGHREEAGKGRDSPRREPRCRTRHLLQRVARQPPGTPRYHPALGRSLPIRREASRSLSCLSVCLSLSLALGKMSRCSLTRASLDHLLKHISHYRTKTFLYIEPEALQLDLHPVSICCQSRWKRQSSHLP